MTKEAPCLMRRSRIGIIVRTLPGRSRRIVGVESPQVFQRLGGLDLCASVDLALTMVVEEEVDLSSEQVPLRGVRLPATEGNRRLGLRGRAGVGQLHPRAPRVA